MRQHRLCDDGRHRSSAASNTPSCFLCLQDRVHFMRKTDGNSPTRVLNLGSLRRFSDVSDGFHGLSVQDRPAFHPLSCSNCRAAHFGSAEYAIHSSLSESWMIQKRRCRCVLMHNRRNTPAPILNAYKHNSGLLLDAYLRKRAHARWHIVCTIFGEAGGFT